jgi:hypothetical protein
VRENMQFLALWAWLTSLKAMFSSFIWRIFHLSVCKWQNFILLYGWVKFYCV